MIERAYFAMCLALGRLLRSAKYSRTWASADDGGRHIRKRRAFYAPLLIWTTAPLFKILDTGVRVLPQRDWEEHERRIYWSLYGASIRIDSDGTLVLPRLDGKTLAAWLDEPELEDSVRNLAIERAVAALVEFHRQGFTHGDAMAENVLVDLETKVARWFDFETVHESGRRTVWRRADDVRALAVTCLIRTAPAKRAEALTLILDAYSDEEVTRRLTTFFLSIFRRPLAFHLAQAGLSFAGFHEIGRLLNSRQRSA